MTNIPQYSNINRYRHPLSTAPPPTTPTLTARPLLLPLIDLSPLLIYSPLESHPPAFADISRLQLVDKMLPSDQCLTPTNYVTNQSLPRGSDTVDREIPELPCPRAGWCETGGDDDDALA